MAAASLLLHAAAASGYRESGISVSALGSQQEKVLIAIRTTAIRLDVPLAAYHGDTRTVRPLGLTHAYLVSLFNLINDRFNENEKRKQDLFNLVQQTFNAGAQQPD